MTNLPPPKLLRVYTKDCVENSRKNNLLLGISIRLPCACNFKCCYCYATKDFPDSLFHEDIINFLNQAIELGTRSVSIVGEGEPFLYNNYFSSKKLKKINIFDLIDFLDKKNIQTIIYSNLSTITEKIAKSLIKKNVFIVGKENALSKNIQNKLSGKDSYEKIQIGLNFLKKVGFNKDKNNSRLSAHTVITKLNYFEIPDLWIKWRKENILPQAQIFVPPSNSKNFLTLQVTPTEIKKLFCKLASIDKQKFGFKWTPRPPIAPFGCTSFFSSCALRPNGDISICAYTDLILGNIKKNSLIEILQTDVAKKIRHIETNLKGACKECSLNKKFYCYGCRAHQYSISKNIFDSYDFCWKA